MYDLVIRNGIVIDGSGAAGVRADVGIVGDRIAALGRIKDSATQEIDASGCIVTPGFVDAHTHLDAQVFWDPMGTCSSWHGVTTAVMGHCGFSLAPCGYEDRSLVTRNLERSEDVPAEAIDAGVEWSWDTFPEYLDAVEKLPMGINFAANIGHSALRSWVMGERAFQERATEDDLSRMAAQLREAVAAGAIGFTTSRNQSHQTPDDQPVASRVADWSEVEYLVRALGETGTGIFQLANERTPAGDEVAAREYWTALSDLVVSAGVPLAFGVLPNGRHLLGVLDDIAVRGGRAVGLSHSRGVSVMLSFQTQLPYDRLAEWKAFRAQPLERQAADLRDPDCRRRLVEAAIHGDYGTDVAGGEARPPDYDVMFALSRPRPPYRTVAEEARELGVHPVDHVIDTALAHDLKFFFVQPVARWSDDDVVEVLRHPRTVMTFSDAGAHASQIADASIQTHLLSYWVRDRGDIALEDAVRMITYAPATAWGFYDRGLLRPGLAADVNVIDMDVLTADMPEVVDDLPGGARRIVQRATGYRATVVGGVPLLVDGEHTGRYPGRLLRNSNGARR